jgi:1,4-dihydroxy-2-naphthoate octaprenyltransferase
VTPEAFRAASGDPQLSVLSPQPRLWLLAARPATLPAAIVPVVVGTAAGTAPFGSRPIQLGPFLAALVAALLIQIGTNFANDVFDFRRGADTLDRLGPVRVTQAGLISPRQVLVATYLTFGLAALIGVYLVLWGGAFILAIGVLSILAGLAYTGGPWPIGYHALGDLFVFVFFGLLAVVGSAYLQVPLVTRLDVWAAVPVGCLVTAIRSSTTCATSRRTARWANAPWRWCSVAETHASSTVCWWRSPT